MSGSDAITALGLSEAVLAWCTANPETLAALAGGEMVAESRDVRDTHTRHEVALRAIEDLIDSDLPEGEQLDQIRTEISRAIIAPAKPQEIARDIGRDDTPPRGRFQDGYGKRPDPSPGMDLTLPNDSQAASGEGQEDR